MNLQLFGQETTEQRREAQRNSNFAKRKKKQDLCPDVRSPDERIATPPFVDEHRWRNIIHIEGSFASGKTELVRRLISDNMGDGRINSVDDPWARFAILTSDPSVFIPVENAVGVSVLGPYLPTKGVCGMDTLTSSCSGDWLFASIDREGRTGRTAVFEHALSFSVSRKQKLFADHGQRYCNVVLDIPLEQRLENLTTRRRRRAEQTGKDPVPISEDTKHNMQEKRKSVVSGVKNIRKLCPEARVFVCESFAKAQETLNNLVLENI